MYDKLPEQKQDHEPSVQNRMRVLWGFWLVGSVIQIAGYGFAYWMGIISLTQCLLHILLFSGGFGFLFYLVGRRLRASGGKRRMPNRGFMRGYYIGIACAFLGPLIWALLHIGISNWFGLGGTK